ncbi:simple sugar transport system permease protein [Nocardiopsis mwathae]|uniref:Simple sugar transport system permease protein n=1 Tax=Nocardiopsis mwathae TaxID=1472723 RepID=A0A7W9YNB9_9ACTN|nr:ABC transporter permease [Nocardiopsis mwathae]MBB6175169.1 simple sugar transport system permease protein [Nocardiopsis mwathae]
MRPTLPIPAGVALAALIGVGVTFLADVVLLAPAALAVGVALAFGAVMLLIGSGTPDATSAVHRTLVTPIALVLSVVTGLLSAAVLDWWLIEPAAYALGALAGALAAFGLYRRLSTTLALAFGAVGAAGVLALLVTAVVLWASGVDAFHAFSRMVEFGTRPDSLVTIVNNGTTFYLSAVAVAIGFKMRLFNIGVDGQYRLAALLAAAVGGAVVLPPVIHQAVIIFVAVCVGGFWAGIAGYLKVTRGVSEVISTIMLNAIATGITAYLLNTDRLAVRISENNIGTQPIPESGWVPGIPADFMGSQRPIFGLTLLAIAVGIGFWFMLNRTRFGFELRATGQSGTAAQASGVDVKRMVFISMVISGMVAGLVGMPQLLGQSHYYALDFPVGLGFTGIAIALLGRNHPVGIAFAALFWAFLDQSAQILDIDGIPKEIAVVTQATIVLTVVVVYEVVHRWGRRYEQQQVGKELARTEVASS